MPRDVPLTADGFEDPDAFFKSPNNETVTRSMALAPATTSKTASTFKKGRMSALAGDDSGEEFEENLLVDEDELDAGGSRACLASLAEGVVGLATPGSYLASRKSGVVDPGADTDEEEPSEVGGPSFRFDGNLDDGVGGNGMDADEEDAEADAGLEEAAMAAEVGSAEEDEDQAPNERERHPRPTGKRGKKRYDLPPAARVRAPKKRTRVSRLENGACPLSFDAKVRDLTTAQRMTTGYTATLCPVVLADNISRH